MCEATALRDMIERAHQILMRGSFDQTASGVNALRYLQQIATDGLARALNRCSQITYHNCWSGKSVSPFTINIPRCERELTANTRGPPFSRIHTNDPNAPHR